MSLYEFCKAVLAAFDGKWPYGGALADARDAHQNRKTVEKCVQEMKDRASRKRK